MRGKISEYQLACAVAEWATAQSVTVPELKLLRVGLEGLRLPIGLAVKAKRMGMKKGWPDLHLPVSRRGYIGLWIELKVANNKPSNPQIEMTQQLMDVRNCVRIVEDSPENAIEIIKWYLGI